MNGAQDLGGTQGHGPINPETDEPVFHHSWEEQVLALTLACGFYGQWNIDTGRHARENIPPAQYLTSSYYQIWLNGLIRLLITNGFITEDEVRQAKPSGPKKELPRGPVQKDEVAAILAKGGPSERDAAAPQKFKVGDRVRTLNINPAGHTRLARYLRKRTGEIVAVHGAHVFPDSNAHGKGEDPKWLYTVRFTARELWGDDANQKDTVNADLWEPYLEPA